MQRRCNVLMPLACPHCQAELLLTMEQFQEERSVRCPVCGDDVNLHPDQIPLPPPEAPPPDPFLWL